MEPINEVLDCTLNAINPKKWFRLILHLNKIILQRLSIGDEPPAHRFVLATPTEKKKSFSDLLTNSFLGKVLRKVHRCSTMSRQRKDIY